MSHGKERKKKNCLNCGSQVKGRFCHICGQENVEPADTFWGLITHFVYDITHFDSKFFTTLKWLITKPGFLSKEYMRGRRAAYLNPIKMYVFTSAFFFILFFTFTKTPEVKTRSSNRPIFTIEQTDSTTEPGLNSKADSQIVADVSAALKVMDSIKPATNLPLPVFVADSASVDSLARIMRRRGKVRSYNLFNDSLPKTVAAYKQGQDTLPESERDSWFIRFVKQKTIHINAKYEGRKDDFSRDFLDKFLHSIPQMMFVSLPLVAFFFSLLYFRHKRFLYVNHGIYTVHLYIAIFILIFFANVSGYIHNYLPFKIFNWISTGFTLGIFYYIYRSMRNFYEQGRGKTILKYVLLLGLVGLLFTILSVVFVINVLLNI